MKKNFIYLLLTAFLLTSCASVPIPVQKNISHDQAMQIITQEVGTQLPERKLYHTYEETRSSETFYVNKKGYRTTEYSHQGTFTLTLTKIEGNYIEGQISFTGDKVGSFPVFGRYNFTTLYLFNSNPSADFPSLWEYQIAQNGRTIKRVRWTDRNVDGILKPWVHELEYGKEVRMYYGKEYRGKITNSTLFIAKTDDYLEEENKNSRKALTYDENLIENENSQKNTTSSESSLTQKLKELKELYDSEIITKTEYDKMRKRLLAED